MTVDTLPRPRATAPPHAAYDVAAVRRDFPILEERVREDKPLVYLDNAASTQKPLAVLEAQDRFQRTSYANVHRGIYELSERATEAYEGARERVRAFLGAPRVEEVVFTRGATEAINLVANTWGQQHLGPGAQILVTEMEHHANVVPWQMLAERTGARLTVAPIDADGDLDLAAFDALLTERTRLVAVTHVSNVLGTVNPVGELIRRAHDAGAKVLIDGAQAVQHMPVDVAALGADFYVFSGHKIYGPTGIGVLWGRHELLSGMPPWQGGGDMIRRVSFAGTTYADPPQRFEAGTPHIVGAVGLSAALDYVERVSLPAIHRHEADLLSYATGRLGEIPGVTLWGTARRRASVVSFTVDGAHPHDVATILDREGICIRAGHHCAQPLMERLGLPSTARAAFAMYNTRAEVDVLAAGVQRVREIFAG